MTDNQLAEMMDKLSNGVVLLYTGTLESFNYKVTTYFLSDGSCYEVKTKAARAYIITDFMALFR